MSKIKMGFDIGNNRMKIAISRAGKLEFHDIRLPENMVENGGITMPNTFAEFLKSTRKTLKLPRGEAALVLPSDQVICRLVTMPWMTEEQLLLNLPYEFYDFIQGDTDKYFCDYAICDDLPLPEEEEARLLEAAASREDPLEDLFQDPRQGLTQSVSQAPAQSLRQASTQDLAQASAQDLTQDPFQEVTMMAAAAAKEQLYQYIHMFSRAGIRLKILLPQEMALIALVKKHSKGLQHWPPDYCFIDLGHVSTKIIVVYHDRIQATRQIAMGGRNLDAAIADHLEIDTFLANSYKINNYQNILESPVCQEIFNRIAVEILKVINFYQFTYPDSRLDGVYLAGGGANVKPLRQIIRDTVGMELLPVDELLPKTEEDTFACLSGLFAAGVSMAEKGD